MQNLRNKISDFQEEVKGFSAEEIIRWVADRFSGKITLASSLGEEDQVLTDMIAREAPGIEVFTLDTGRLHQETYELLSKTQKKYPQLKFRVMFPDSGRVEQMVQDKGINLFYDSVENRKLCCHVRKVEPLQRALQDKQAWITGLRRAQAVTRSQLEAVEWDEGNNLIKISPLYKWSLDDVHQYIKGHHVDINPLHARGFLSIGCAPCTRAVKEGEDIRAGRWWWETPESKECGLHNSPNRKNTKVKEDTKTHDT